MEIKSINLLTHNDLDGAACAIVTEHCAKLLNLPFELTFSDNQNLAKNFEAWKTKMITAPEGCSLNIISDLPLASLSKDFIGLPTCELEHPMKPNDQVIRSNILIDHHIDSLENPDLSMCNYECAIELGDMGARCRACAALLVWRYFREYFQLDIDELYEFVNMVKDFDTHSYPATLNPLSEKYNLLYFQMGYEWFRGYILDNLGTSLARMDPTVKVLCNRLYNSVRIEVSKRVSLEKWDRVVIGGTDVLVQLCDNKSIYSELGAAVSRQWCMIAMMICSDGSVSLRSVGTVDNLDCNRIAKFFGGGGHRNAAGCRITRGQFKTMMGGGFAECKLV